MRAIVLVTAAVILSWNAWATPPDYFPLQVGNQWIYRCSGFCEKPVLQLEITQATEFNGYVYHRLHGFPGGDPWLRMDENGSLLAYDPDQNLERLWYAFLSPNWEVYITAVPGTCCSFAMVTSRNAEYQGPIGQFNSALDIWYPWVFQVGLVRELFLPYIGLIHRTQATGGPTSATYDLIYSRNGGRTFVSEPVLAFGLSVDQTTYDVNLMPGPDAKQSTPVMTALLTLRSTNQQPLRLVFPTTQDYDLVIRNENNEIVYRWSDGKGFPEVLRRVDVESGEKNYGLLVPLADKEGKPLPPGKYIAEATLATMPPQTYSASVSFEIQHVF